MEFSIATITNITAIIIMGGLFISVYKGMDFVYSDVKAICVMSGLTVLESAFEVTGEYITGDSTLIWLNYLSSTSLFFINVLVGITWCIFVKIKVSNNKKRVKMKGLAVIAIPGVLVCVLSLINIYTPVFYYITQDNVYMRTDYYIWSVLVAGFYMLYGFVEFAIKNRKTQRYAFYPTISFLLPVLIYQIIQMFYEELSLTSLGLSMGIVALYLSHKNESACIDYLSGIFNRQYFERFLDNAIKNRRKTTKYLSGIMIDIDRFKTINDTYGHLVGNDAICKAAELLLEVESYTNNKIYAFRYGGDEFALLQWVENEAEIENIMKALKIVSDNFNAGKSKPYEINFSRGYAIYYDDDTLQSFVSRMDSAMYKNKQLNRKQIGEK